MCAWLNFTQTQMHVLHTECSLSELFTVDKILEEILIYY